MNRYLYIIITWLLLSCGSSKTTMISIPENSVRASLEYLASDELEGRNTGSKGIEKAAVFIEDYFKENNIKPYFETYRDHFKVKDLDAFNLVGYLEGSDSKLKEEVIIIGAHYDHIGVISKVVENDSIANGANDNGAGTSSVLAIAEYFGRKKTNKRSLMFVLFSAEEMGLLGSKHLAKRLKGEEFNLYTMFNIEMVGVPMQNKSYKAYLTGHKTSNMFSKVNQYANDSAFIGFYTLAETYNLFKRSDNYPFYSEFKIPAQTLSTSDDYPFYHHVDDEIDKIDFSHLKIIIDKMIEVLEKMSNTLTQEIKLNNE